MSSSEAAASPSSTAPSQNVPEASPPTPTSTAPSQDAPDPAAQTVGKDDSDGNGVEAVVDLEAALARVKVLISESKFEAGVELLDPLLSDLGVRNGTDHLAEIHLLLSKCHYGLGKLKLAISSANSAISLRPKWKDPFLYRSACFQSLQSALQGSSKGLEESEDIIERDKNLADLIVDPSSYPSEDTCCTNGKRVFQTLSSAISEADDGETIFVESGNYVVASNASQSGISPLFLCGKNLTIIGRSAKDVVLEYKRDTTKTNAVSRLDTFMIAGSVDGVTLVKRVTFRNENTDKNSNTRFIGLAAGSLQLEDCYFDGSANPEVDAVFLDSKIIGSAFAKIKNFGPPKLLARHCIFDNCKSYASVVASSGNGTVVHLENCYFIGSRVVAKNGAELNVDDCEFGVLYDKSNDSNVSASSGSTAVVMNTYFHGSILGQHKLSRGQAVSVSERSTAVVNSNYIHRTGNGVLCWDSVLTCTNNIIESCARQVSAFSLENLDLSSTAEQTESQTTSGMNTGVSLKKKSVQTSVVADNLIRRCDVGVYVGDGSAAHVKANSIESSHFAGVFVECEAKPNIVNNVFRGFTVYESEWRKNEQRSKPKSQWRTGVGILCVLRTAGMIAKNLFENFRLAPVMIFDSCRPFVRDNGFDPAGIEIVRPEQEARETELKEMFNSEVFRIDKNFYVIFNEQIEKEVFEEILKGPPPEAPGYKPIKTPSSSQCNC